MTAHKILVSIFLFVISASRVLGQSSSNVSKQFWLDFNPTRFQSVDLEIRGSFGVRRELENNGWWRLLAVPQVRYYLGNNLFATGGIGGYYTFNETIDNRFQAIQEQRVWRIRAGGEGFFTLGGQEGQFQE